MAFRAREAKIRYLPVFVGGLLGGVLSNLSGVALGALVLREDAGKFVQAMESPPGAARMLIEHVLMRFGIGLAAAWLYAAIGPRFEGKARAVAASVTFLWLVTYLFSAIILEELRMYSTRTAFIGAAWGFVELVLVCACVVSVYRPTPARTHPGG